MTTLTHEIIGACIEVHKHFGPGLLEAVYEEALVHELSHRGLLVTRQQLVALEYKGLKLANHLRLDLLVRDRSDSVLVEIKSVEQIVAVHEAQILTYLRLAGCRFGLLVNFNVPALRHGGIRRYVSGYG